MILKFCVNIKLKECVLKKLTFITITFKTFNKKKTAIKVLIECEFFIIFTTVKKVNF